MLCLKKSKSALNCLVSKKNIISTAAIFLVSAKLSAAPLLLGYTPQVKPTISGISSGAFMSVQMATIFSNQFSGVGTVAGGFFYCAQNYLQEKINEGQANLFIGQKNLLGFKESKQYYSDIFDPIALVNGDRTKWLEPNEANPIYMSVGVCMGRPSDAQLPDLKKMEAENKISSLDNFKNLKTYIYHGKNDSMIRTDMSGRLKEFYTSNGIADDKIKVTIGEGGHNFPTDKEGLNDCSTEEIPYISSCHLNVAEEVLHQLTGLNLEKSDVNKNSLYVVDQNLDFKNKVLAENTWAQPAKSLAPYAYMYASNFCLENPASCQTHVALHGCKMSDSFNEDFDQKYTEQIAKYQILTVSKKPNELDIFNILKYPYIEQKVNKYGTLKFALTAGYAEYAEKNNLVILFPQTWITEQNYPYNPKGCWDWFGWTGDSYATQEGVETKWMMSYIKAVSQNPKDFILNVRPHFDAIEAQK